MGHPDTIPSSSAAPSDPTGGTPMDKKAVAEAAILAVFTRPTFSFSDAYVAGDRAVGERGFSYRLADRLLQRERKAGRIRLTASNKRLWEPAPADGSQDEPRTADSGNSSSKSTS